MSEITNLSEEVKPLQGEKKLKVWRSPVISVIIGFFAFVLVTFIIIQVFALSPESTIMAPGPYNDPPASSEILPA